MVLFNFFAAIFFLVAGVLLGTTVVAWRRIDSPAVNLFAVVAGTLGIGSFLVSFGFATNSSDVVLATIIAIAMIIPIPWIMFSLDYIGKENLSSMWTAGLFSIPVTLGLSATIAIFASQTLPGFTFLVQDNPSRLAVVFITVLELSQWGGILYAGGLVLTGTGLILWSFQRYPHLNSLTGTVLCTFGAVPWISVLFALQLESISFFVFSGTVAIGFSIGAIAAVALVGPSPLFDRVPAAGNVGPTTVIAELEDAVIIADGEEQVIELNPAARRLFGGEQVIELNPTTPQLFEKDRATMTTDIPDLFGSSLEELRDRTPVVIESEERQDLFDPTVSELTDQHGHLLGYAIVLRDVTEPTIRQQRLEVLNRVLRHNLRNDMSIMLGWLDVIQNDTDDPSVLDKVETISETGQGLVELSEKIQESEKMLEVEVKTSQRIRIESVVRTIFESFEATQNVDFHYQGPEEIPIMVTREELKFSLKNLIENAVQHNDSDDIKVWVQITHRPEETYPLEIAVLDNGPGIPEEERKIITRGHETSLRHSSGIGLWIVRWIARSQGGKISFADRNPNGTIVKLFFPTGDHDEDGRTGATETTSS